MISSSKRFIRTEDHFAGTKQFIIITVSLSGNNRTAFVKFLLESHNGFSDASLLPFSLKTFWS